jgi:hypothetical protein
LLGACALRVSDSMFAKLAPVKPRPYVSMCSIATRRYLSDSNVASAVRLPAISTAQRCG